MSGISYDLVYDVQHFLQSRIKSVITLGEFLAACNDELFLVEYKSEDGDHHIIWCKIAKQTSVDSLDVYDARTFDECFLIQHIKDLAVCRNKTKHSIKLNRLLALRFRSKRYNWNSDSQLFLEE